jgi:acyl CoA:acetate/3-ketoacid CoA transferase alpha subunit
MSSKVCKTVAEALKGLKSNHKVLIGGFGICGIAMNLINGVKSAGVNNLHVFSNTAGIDNWGVGVLIRQPGLVKRVTGSYVGENK